MKVVVNPLYPHLREFIYDIPACRYTCDQVLHEGRNTIEQLTAPDGTILVVKRYKKPTWLNQLVYSGLRWSKARRSYEYALRFAQYHLKTAEPVAYIETYKYGIFHTGYYITRHIPDRLLADIHTCSPEEQALLLRDFAFFTANLHVKGIQHGDYNPRNVFFRLEENGYHFSLIDINRLKFKKMSKKDCAREFRRMLDRKDLVTVVEHYAAFRGWDVDLFCGSILMMRALRPRDRLKDFLHVMIRPFCRNNTSV